jgi:hypothetical protein
MSGLDRQRQKAPEELDKVLQHHEVYPGLPEDNAKSDQYPCKWGLTHHVWDHARAGGSRALDRTWTWRLRHVRLLSSGYLNPWHRTKLFSTQVPREMCFRRQGQID